MKKCKKIAKREGEGEKVREKEEQMRGEGEESWMADKDKETREERRCGTKTARASQSIG